MAGSQTEHHIASELSSTISNGVVGLLREYTGRGPTKARTYIKDDLISVVLEDSLTKGERSLVLDGETSLVLTSRRAYQRTMQADLIALVEGASGRKVRAFLSDNHLEPDIAVESFVMAPVASPDSGVPVNHRQRPAKTDPQQLPAR